MIQRFLAALRKVFCKEPLIIGGIYERKTASPFDSKEYAEVIDLKNGWVKYEVTPRRLTDTECPKPPSSWHYELPEETFRWHFPKLKEEAK